MREICRVLLLCALSGLCACQTSEEAPSRGSPALRPGDEAFAGSLRFRVRAAPGDMAGVRIQVFAGDALAAEGYVGLEAEPLPASLAPEGASGGLFGAATFVLAPGKYRVKATPMNSPTEPSPGCAPVEREVLVRPGQTEEVVLVSGCDQPGNGGLDVIVTTDHAPVVTSLVFDPSKFLLTCQPLTVRATFTDQDGDAITYRWSLEGAPAGAAPVLAPRGSELDFTTSAPGLYTLEVAGCDPRGLCASLTFPVHVALSSDEDGDGLGDGCEDPAAASPGRVVTLVMTMSDQHMLVHPFEVVPKLLTGNAVRWVSPVEKPLVAVVRDDNLGGETPADPEFVATLLRLNGFEVELLEEPADGLTLALVERFDVVWFANPGYRVDDQRTVEVLLALHQAGRGLVLQGDDITWNPGLAPLTHLSYQDNGETSCGVAVNDDQGGSYLATVQTLPHPVILGLEGTQFRYGDDIDLSVLVGKGGQVLATATLDPAHRCDNQPCPVTPLIVAFDPKR